MIIVVMEKGKKMPTKETHEIKMMYAVYADGREEPIVIDEIKDLSLEEAEPILEEHNFVKVTRCKDCKYMCHYTDGHIECRLLSDLKPIPTTYCTMNADDFCSYGERREDDK